jgi:hypothetical protein
VTHAIENPLLLVSDRGNRGAAGNQAARRYPGLLNNAGPVRFEPALIEMIALQQLPRFEKEIDDLH